MKVYIAGPMSGKHLNNFPAFFRAALALRELGLDPVNPAEHDMAGGFDPNGTLVSHGRTKHDTMREDFKLLLDCDAIALLPEWNKSEGARAERMVSDQIGQVVLFMNNYGRLEAALL